MKVLKYFSIGLFLTLLAPFLLFAASTEPVTTPAFDETTFPSDTEPTETKAAEPAVIDDLGASVAGGAHALVAADRDDHAGAPGDCGRERLRRVKGADAGTQNGHVGGAAHLPRA